MGKAKRIRKARASARAERRQTRRWFGLSGAAREGFAIGLALSLFVQRLTDAIETQTPLLCGACGGRWVEDHDDNGRCDPLRRASHVEQQLGACEHGPDRSCPLCYEPEPIE